MEQFAVISMNVLQLLLSATLKHHVETQTVLMSVFASLVILAPVITVLLLINVLKVSTAVVHMLAVIRLTPPINVSVSAVIVAMEQFAKILMSVLHLILHVMNKQFAGTQTARLTAFAMQVSQERV